jgi:hypothetical protein
MRALFDVLELELDVAVSTVNVRIVMTKLTTTAASSTHRSAAVKIRTSAVAFLQTPTKLNDI